MASGFGPETERLESRLADIARLRRGYLAHLGESVLGLVRTDPELRASREELISAIDACDAERARTEDLLASAEARAFAREQTASTAPEAAGEQTVPAPESWPPDPDEPKAAVEQELLGADDAVAAAATVVLPPVADAVAAAETVVLPPVADTFAADEAPAPTEGAGGAPEALATVRLRPLGDEGADVEAQTEPETPPMAALTCPACGAPVGEGHKFCMSCGHRLR